jgi:hypothetical protein
MDPRQNFTGFFLRYCLGLMTEVFLEFRIIVDPSDFIMVFEWTFSFTFGVNKSEENPLEITFIFRKPNFF